MLKLHLEVIGKHFINFTKFFSEICVENFSSDLVFEKFFEVNFLCPFQMQNFPFDHQECEIIMESAGNERFYVKLKALNISYNGPMNIAQYVIGDMKIGDFANGTVLKAHIRIERRISNEILTKIFPTIIIVLVKYISLKITGLFRFVTLYLYF